MDDLQLYHVAKKLYDLNGLYWAPETITQKLYEHISNDEKYGKAIIVLHENYIPFKNRILGNIKDTWFSNENFHDIASECYEILSKIDTLEDWQIELKIIFKNMNDKS